MDNHRLLIIFKSSLRMYFAPLLGAIKGAKKAIFEETERRKKELYR